MRAAVILCGALLLVACSDDAGGSLAERDPKGAEACRLLAEALANEDGRTDQIGKVTEAGEAGAESTTKSIRATINNDAGRPLPHSEKLRDACDAEGVDMPAFPG